MIIFFNVHVNLLCRQTTIDYVGQIQEKLEDLSSGQCVFNRDGSIIPIRDNSSLLVSATRWNRLDSKGLSRKDGSGQYLPRSVMSSTSSPVLKVTAKKRRRRRKKHLPNCTKPNCTRCLRARNHRLKISRDNERECSSATNQTIKLTSPIRDGNQNSNNSCMSVEGSDNLGYSQAKGKSMHGDSHYKSKDSQKINQKRQQIYY